MKEDENELPVTPSLLRSTDNSRTWMFAAKSMSEATRLAELNAQASEVVVKVVQMDEENYIAVARRRSASMTIHWTA